MEFYDSITATVAVNRKFMIVTNKFITILWLVAIATFNTWIVTTDTDTQVSLSNLLLVSGIILLIAIQAQSPMRGHITFASVSAMSILLTMIGYQVFQTINKNYPNEANTQAI